MTDDFDRQLCKECPNLYADRHASMRETCMCWGFDTGPGWNKLIRDLSLKLEALILQFPEEERRYYRASQVKEKYGTLRFYMIGATDEMFDLIDQAEEDSCKICEECGEPGEERPGGWIKTLCDKCWSEQEQKQAERLIAYKRKTNA